MSAARFGSACVASPHRLASESGLAVLRAGGNALDAAIATNLTLGVVTPYYCGFGGDLFAMVWDGAAHGYNGSGRAPVAALARDVGGTEGGFGPQAVTVPGAVEGWFALLDRFGTRTFAELARDALRHAREGVPLSTLAAGYIARASAQYEHEREWQRIYGGLGAGAVMRQPDLARTIEALCAGGPDAYYRGEIAVDVVAELRARGGVMALEDLAAHRGDWVEPMRARFRDAEVLELPPNTQGVTALEAMRISDGFAVTDPEGPVRHHLMIEAAKLALADRNAYVADAGAMPLAPEVLLSDPWIDARRAAIDPERAQDPSPGREAPGGTAYMCAADASGTCVSLIQSNWNGFGSGIVVPGWGINLHNRGDLFVREPGHPNALEPGKRPLHTLIPAIVLRDGRPWLVLGTMGGDGQAQIHLQVLTRILDDGLDIQDAIDAPRWVVRPRDWTVVAETGIGATVMDGLRARGHRLHVAAAGDPVGGHAHAIEVMDGGYAAASDARAEGAALGF